MAGYPRNPFFAMALKSVGFTRNLVLSSMMAGAACQALTISLDYTPDQATMNFFSLRPQAKAALDAAAADLSALLAPTHFTGISPSGTPNVDLISGVNGGTHVDANWDLEYTNPATGVSPTARGSWRPAH